MASKCKTCAEPIGWEAEDGKWFPLNMDGTRHRKHSDSEKRATEEAKREAAPAGEPRRTRPCRDCNAPIWFKEKDGGGWEVLSLDNTPHRCKRKGS